MPDCTCYGTNIVSVHDIATFDSQSVKIEARKQYLRFYLKGEMSGRINIVKLPL